MCFLCDDTSMILVSIEVPRHLFKAGGSVITGRLSDTGEFVMEDILVCEGIKFNAAASIRSIVLFCIASKTKPGGPIKLVARPSGDWDKYMALSVQTGDSIVIMPDTKSHCTYRFTM